MIDSLEAWACYICTLKSDLHLKRLQGLNLTFYHITNIESKLDSITNTESKLDSLSPGVAVY